MPSTVFSSTYSMSGYSSKTYQVRISYAESYDQSANRSAVSITGVELRIEGNATNWGSLAFFGSVAVNGTTLLRMNGGASVRVSLSGAGFCSVAIPASSSVAVAHADDGTGSFTLSVVGGFSYNGASWFCALYNNQPFGVKSQSRTLALTARPRASAIVSAPTRIATGETLSLSVARASAAFRHRASVTVGNSTLFQSEAFETALSMPVSRTWFSGFPAQDTLEAVLAVQTYADESCTTPLGAADTAALTITADEGMRPVLAPGWVTLSPRNEGAAASFSGYIRGISRAQAVFDDTKIDLSAAVGAAIASYTLRCQGETVSAAPWITDVLASEAPTVLCTVTDSRGRSASESVPLAVMDYARPSLGGISIFRCDASGAPDENGSRYSAAATLSYASLGGQNSCILRTAVAPAGGSFGQEETLSTSAAHVSAATLSPDLSYTVRLRAVDALGAETVYSHRLPTRRWAMKFRPDGNGVAFGKAAEYGGALELPGDWDIRLGSESWLSRIYPVGSLYLSTAATDPAALFGGSWERIEDVFLLASGSGWAPGSRGGEASHTLSIAELPAHGHDGLYWGVDYKQTPYPWGLNNDGVGNGFSSAYNGSSRGGPNASHAMYTGPSGGGEAHNNMPPYLAVFVWKRTA